MGAKKFNKFAILMAIFACVALNCILAEASPIAWVEPSMKIMQQDDSNVGLGQIDLYAAKGEWESFQIIVRAPAGGLTNVNVSYSGLDEVQVDLYREHYVYLTQGTSDWWPQPSGNRPRGTAGYYPDALIPFVHPETGVDLSGAILNAVPFNLAAAKNQPIWVDIFVPRTAEPGLHQGIFTITSGQGQTTIICNLHIWDFELPSKPALKSCFRYHRSVHTKITNYDKELLKHRLMPGSVSASDEPTFMSDPDFRLNCTGVRSGGRWSWPSDIRIATPPSVKTIQEAVAGHVPDIYLHYYLADEIGTDSSYHDALKAWGRNFHGAGVNSLVTMRPIPALFDDGSGTGRSAVDIWVMLPKTYYNDTTGHGNIDFAAIANVEQAIQKGDECWSYNCVLQDEYSPKWLIDFPPINFRIQGGFINQSLGLTGLLYWAVDIWATDAWNNVEASYVSKPGEGILVYPGEQVGLPGRVVGSMRLKWLRDSVDDYDYIDILKNLGQGEWALAMSRSIAPDWINWTKDPNELESTRYMLGEEIEGILNGGGSNNPPTANDQSVSTGEDVPVAITLTASDPDGDALTYTIVTPPGRGSLRGAAPNLTYTPNPNVYGSDLFTFKVNDGEFDSNIATVSLSMTSINDAPFFDPAIGDRSVDIGSTLSFTATVSNIDRDILTFSATGLPTGATFTKVDNYSASFSWTPQAGQEGNYSVTFNVRDYMYTTSETIKITVINPTQAPILSYIPPVLTGAEGQWFTIPKITATDPDGDTLTMEMQNAPGGVRFFQTDSRPGYVEYKLRWPDKLVKAGTYEVTFMVSDGSLTDSKIVMIEVLP